MSLIWGSTWIVIQVGLHDLPPFTGLAARFGIAALGFIVLARFLGPREGGKAPPRLLALVLGTLYFTGSYTIVYWSEQYLPSALASLLFASYPLMLAVVSHFALRGERLRAIQFGGLAIGFVGVAFLLLADVPKLGPEALVPAFVMLGSPFVVTLGTIYVKRHGTGVSSLALNRDGMLVSFLEVAILAAVVERDSAVRITWPAVASVLYLAIFGTVVTFGIYFWLLRTAPANLLALVSYLTPAIAVFLGMVVGDEPITRSTLLGAALIFVGMYFASRRKRAGA